MVHFIFSHFSAATNVMPLLSLWFYYSNCSLINNNVKSTGKDQTKTHSAVLLAVVCVWNAIGLVKAHTHNRMDKELHHTRRALHMEAFTDAQMWSFSETGWDGEKQTKHKTKRKRAYLNGLGSDSLPYSPTAGTISMLCVSKHRQYIVHALWVR